MKNGDSNTKSTKIEKRHFEKALIAVKPSVSEVDVAKYEHMSLSLRSTRSHVDTTAN